MMNLINESNSPTIMEESKNEEVSTQESLNTPKPLAVTRPKREICSLAHFVDMVASTLLVVDDDILVTYREALQSSKSDKWKSTMDKEMQSFQKNNT